MTEAGRANLSPVMRWLTATVVVWRMRGVEAGLLAAFGVTWDAAMSSLVPGGLWLDRAPENGADGTPLKTPYAEITVTPGPAQYAAAPKYLKTFAVRVMVWSVAGATNAGTIQQAVGSLLDPPPGRAAPPGLSVTGCDVARVDDAGGEFALDAARVKAKDVLIAAAAWDVLLGVPR